MEPQLTPKEAFAAMYLFLDKMYKDYGFDQLGGILGGMSLLADGGTADPAYWDDWLRMVEIARGQHPDIGLHIKDNRGPSERP
jgi:hypothetical protein